MESVWMISLETAVDGEKDSYRLKIATFLFPRERDVNLTLSIQNRVCSYAISCYNNITVVFIPQIISTIA